MEIEGLPEGGTQLTSLRDLLVSLQKQDPPIDVCFEVLGSPDKPSECVCLCVCVTMCAHVTNVCVSPCLQNPPYVGQMGKMEDRDTPGLAPLLLSIRQGWLVASRQVSQAYAFSPD